MLEGTYIEWVFAGLAIALYLYIWMRGIRSIAEIERRKRERNK